MREWTAIIENINTFDAETIEKEFKAYLEQKGTGIGKVLQPFRLVLTGKGMGPSMFEIATLLGKEETLKRMQVNLSTIEKIKGK